MNLIRGNRQLLLAAISLSAIAGCGDDGVVKEKPSLLLSSDNVTVAEGGTMTFTATLSEPVGTAGQVQINLGDTNVATVSPQLISFDANEVGPVTVTLTGVQDDDLADDMTSALITSELFAAVSLNVTVDDDDTQALVLSANALTLGEGTTGSVGVSLAFQPAADTSVTIASADTARLGASPTTLTFTSSNFRNPQNVTLAAGEDADAVNNNVNVTVSTAGVTDGTVAVAITDNDVQNIVANVQNVALVEGGAAGTFQVVLSQQPTSDVTLNVASTDVGAATVSPSTLTFTAANYATGSAHVVTVTPVSDNDTANESLNVDISGGSLTTLRVPTTVMDDDVVAIQVAGTISVTEGATAQLPVTLSFDPGAQVSVTVTSTDTSSVSVAPTVLTFDSSNYFVPQNVTVTGVEDVDLANETTSVTLASTGLATRMTTVSVTDNDTQAINLSYAGSPGTLNLPESTTLSLSTANVQVTLGFQPAAAVTVNVGSNNADLTVGTATLTFDMNNYNIPQTITLTAVDEVDLLDESATVTFSAGSTTRTLNVTIPDTDVQGFAVTPVTLPVINEGNSTTFQVSLNFAPSAAVSATISSNNPDILVNGSSSTSITIPVANTPQTITVSVAQDPDAADETATLTISDVAVVIPDRTLSVSGNDDETMQFVLTPATMNVDGQRLDVIEEGQDVTFTVALSAAPEANATVTITPSITNVVSVSNGGAFGPATTVTFTPGAFGPQTITVRGLADPNLVDEVFNVTVSGPPSLGAADAFEYMRKIENDAQSIITTPAEPGPLLVTEGSSGDLLIRLQYQPVSSTQITVTPSNPNILLNGASAPVTLLFTTTNYDQEQTVVVTTPDDADQFDPVAGSITVSSPALASRVVNVTLLDDDDQVIVLNKSSISITEFNTMPFQDSFTVTLGFQPTEATESITLTVPASGIGKFELCDGNVLAHGGPVCGNTLVLTFDDTSGTAPGWDVPQTVIVRSIDDADVLDEAGIVTLASDRAPFATNSIPVDVTDNDIQNIAQSTTTVALVEDAGSGSGGSGSIGVHLTQDPSGTLTVTATSADPGAVAVAPATLDFTTATYPVDQFFTVTPVSDPDVRDESVTVTLSAPGVTSKTVTVTVADDDQQSFVATGTLNIDEGGNASLSVNLSHQPTNPVTVLVTSEIVQPNAGGQSLTLNNGATASLTFDSVTWNTIQTVTIAAPEDADLDHFTGNIRLHVTSTQTGRELAADVLRSFAVRDNDSQSIILTASPAGLINSAQENGPYVEFLVHLGSRPRNGVNDTVQLTAPANTRFIDTNNTTATLSFGVGNFATDQVVRWYVIDSASTNFTGAISLAVDETGDVPPPFGAGNASAAAMQAIRAFDDETQPIINQIDYPTGFNGATNFTQRSNVAWAPDGTAEGRVAFTARTTPTGGSSLLGFTTRALDTTSTGPTIATGGLEPTTEIVLYNADGGGTWDVFSSSATGIVFARYGLTGAVVLAPTVVSPASDSPTDFSVARNGSVYGVIYRREAISRNNLYFRNVTIATGAASGEVISTTANAFIHFHPTLHAVPGSVDGNTAAFAAIYNENGNNKLVRLNANGAPLGTVTFGLEFPGQNFSHSVYTESSFYGPMIWATNVVNVGPGQGDNIIRLYVIGLSTSTPVAFVDGAWDLTDQAITPISPVSPPFIAFNQEPDFASGGDFAIAYDSNLNGTNRVGVALWNLFDDARVFPLDAVGDEGLYPSLAWAKDRWVLRYQTDNPAATGIRLRTGSFEGPSQLLAATASKSFNDAARRVGLMR